MKKGVKGRLNSGYNIFKNATTRKNGGKNSGRQKVPKLTIL